MGIFIVCLLTKVQVPVIPLKNGIQVRYKIPSSLYFLSKKSASQVIKNFLKYHSYHQSHRSHRDKCVARIDSVEGKGFLFVEVVDSHKETDDEPEVISYEKCPWWISILEMFTKCRYICRNNKGDRESPEEIISRFHRLSIFSLEIDSIHPCFPKYWRIIPDDTDEHSHYSCWDISGPRDIRDDVKNVRKYFHSDELYSLV